MIRDAIGTKPFSRKRIRVRNPNTRVVKPLMFAFRVFTLNHIIILWLTTDTILNRFSGFLFSRCWRFSSFTPCVVVIDCIFVLRILQLGYLCHTYFLWFLCLPFGTYRRRIQIRSSWSVLDLNFNQFEIDIQLLSCHRIHGSLYSRQSCELRNDFLSHHITIHTLQQD